MNTTQPSFTAQKGTKVYLKTKLLKKNEAIGALCQDQDGDTFEWGNVIISRDQYNKYCNGKRVRISNNKFLNPL